MAPKTPDEPTGTVAALTELRASVTTDITRLCRDVDKLFEVTTDLREARATIEERLEATRGDLTARLDSFQRSMESLTAGNKFRPEDFVTKFEMLQHDREADGVVRNVANLMTDVNDVDNRVAHLQTNLEAKINGLSANLETAIEKQLKPVIDSLKADRDAVKEDRKTIMDLKDKVNALMLKFSIAAAVGGVVIGKLFDVMLKASGVSK